MLNRDARHIALADVGAAGQQRIADGTVLIIGAGGIGCATATYLAASGVGHIRLADFDTIDETNLARQFLYGPQDVGKRKAIVAAERLNDQHPDIKVEALVERMSDDTLTEAIAGVDVVLDGCDNFATRFAVNDACVRNRKTLISGAAIRLEGQIAVFGPNYDVSPCYRCLYSEADESLESCSGNGVLSPVPGVVGTLMAVEAIKKLARMPLATSRLTLYDARRSEFRSVAIQKRQSCAGCAH